MTEQQKQKRFEALLEEGAKENIQYWKNHWTGLKSLFSGRGRKQTRKGK